MNNKKTYTSLEALRKAESYCVYQDRCHQEVRNKLLEWGIYYEELENILNQLIDDNFLNEERFAKSYARGKFRIKKWGKIKIEIELKRRNISSYCIREGLKEIDFDEYLETLSGLIVRNEELLLTPTTKNKLIQQLLRKGYEYELIKETIKQQ